MKVWILWDYSEDSPLFKGVFSSKDDAKASVPVLWNRPNRYGTMYSCSDMYFIEEHTIKLQWRKKMIGLLRDKKKMKEKVLLMAGIVSALWPTAFVVHLLVSIFTYVLLGSPWNPLGLEITRVFAAMLVSIPLGGLSLVLCMESRYVS